MKSQPTLIRITVGIIFLSLIHVSVEAQDSRQLTREKSRLALVIGNAAYRNAPQLANPVNDARDMSAALKQVGFEVLSGENLTADKMKRLIIEFGEK